MKCPVRLQLAWPPLGHVPGCPEELGFLCVCFVCVCICVCAATGVWSRSLCWEQAGQGMFGLYERAVLLERTQHCQLPAPSNLIRTAHLQALQRKAQDW